MNDAATIQLQSNLNRIRDRIEAACHRANRDISAVRLVAVTKYVTLSVARAIVQCGCLDLGESRPQELEQKAQQMDGITWHQIGHIQSNKVRRAVRWASWIHSVDSVDLIQRINRVAKEEGRCPQILIQVNVSGERSKQGIHPGEAIDVLDQAQRQPNLKCVGLMTMAPLAGDLETTRKSFIELARLRDDLVMKGCPFEAVAELSMGMSGDFEIAIEHGATIVRVGSALFEGIDPQPGLP